MRIFNSLTLSCLFSIVAAQTPNSVQFTRMDSLMVQEALQNHLQKDVSANYEYRLKAFTPNDSIKALYELFLTDRQVDQIVYRKNMNIKRKVLNQIFSPIRNTPVSEKELNSSLESIKNAYSFMIDTPNYSWGNMDGKNGIVIDFIPSFKHQFSAIVGAKRHKNNSWEASGEIEINIENIFQNAESINLYWKKLDTLSQEIQFHFNQPHLFGTPIGVDISFDRNAIDGLFTESISTFNMSTRQSFVGVMSAGYEKSNIRATESGINLGYLTHDVQSFVAKLKSTSMNSRWLPTNGYSYELAGKIGQIQKDLLYELLVKWNRIIPIKGPWFGRIAIWGQKITSLGLSIPQSRYIRFGGMQTIKGFRENAFHSEWVLSPEIHSTYILNEHIHFSSFYQLGWFDENLSPIQSVGIGLKQVEDTSIIEIQYAVPLNAPISEGHLHFKYISRF